jgi:hypothetical protein
MDLHPLAPIAATPQGGSAAPKVPRLRRRGRHPIALNPLAIHFRLPRAPTGLLAPSCRPPDQVRAKPSLQILHCQRAVQPPKKHGRSSPSPIKSRHPQGYGIFCGGLVPCHRHSSGRGAGSIPLSAPSVADRHGSQRESRIGVSHLHEIRATAYLMTEWAVARPQCYLGAIVYHVVF